MIVQVVHHDVKEGMRDAALARINALTTRMEAIDGFVFRHVGEVVDQPSRITTFTAWVDSSSLDRWERERARTTSQGEDARQVYLGVSAFRVDTSKAVR